MFIRFEIPELDTQAATRFICMCFSFNTTLADDIRRVRAQVNNPPGTKNLTIVTCFELLSWFVQLFIRTMGNIGGKYRLET